MRLGRCGLTGDDWEGVGLSTWTRVVLIASAFVAPLGRSDANPLPTELTQCRSDPRPASFVRRPTQEVTLKGLGYPDEICGTLSYL